MTTALQQSYDRAEQVTAEWARSFYFASRWLVPDKRRAVFALYDYCRHVDNIVDERGDASAGDVERALDAVRRDIEALASGRDVPGRWLALADTLRRYPVPTEPLLALIDGVAMDIEPRTYHTWGELQHYCRLVAGGVGLMLGPVLGAESHAFQQPGVNLGVAMQLTNILRDLGEDLDRGRCYLPLEDLAVFGLTVERLDERTVSDAFIALMKFQVARARALFDEASDVIPFFPPDGSRLTVRLLQKTYAGILDVIEQQGYDVFRQRAYTSTQRKLLILGREWLAERGSAAVLMAGESRA